VLDAGDSGCAVHCPDPFPRRLTVIATCCSADQFADLLKTGDASSDVRSCGTIALTLWLYGLRTSIFVTFRAPSILAVAECPISGGRSVTEQCKHRVMRRVLITKF